MRRYLVHRMLLVHMPQSRGLSFLRALLYTVGNIDQPHANASGVYGHRLDASMLFRYAFEMSLCVTKFGFGPNLSLSRHSHF